MNDNFVQKIKNIFNNIAKESNNELFKFSNNNFTPSWYLPYIDDYPIFLLISESFILRNRIFINVGYMDEPNYFFSSPNKNLMYAEFSIDLTEGLKLNEERDIWSFICLQILRAVYPLLAYKTNNFDLGVKQISI